MLFVNIGWSEGYDGRESVVGGHSWLREHADIAAESCAFARRADGFYRSGVGRGRLSDTRLHVVFVARDPKDRLRRVVGAYVAAEVVGDNAGWVSVQARDAVLFPADDRPEAMEWKGRVRRWARRDRGSVHPPLWVLFEALRPRLQESVRLGEDEENSEVAADLDVVAAMEGRRRLRLTQHRVRERGLREAKIRAALGEEGRLRCEVPGCGFDFHERYGEVGAGFAEVHHLRPLSEAGEEGRETAITDLAIVCANCHRMVHRHGLCRSLRSLLPDTPGASPSRPPR